MQDNHISVPRLQLSKLHLLKSHRMVAASALALLMAAALAGTASAKAVPIVNSTSLSLVTTQSAAEAGEVTGVVIVAVDPESPAAQAGVERGDILLSVNDMAIDSTAALFAAVSGSLPGDAVELSLLHGDEPRTIPVTFAQRGDRAYLGVQVVDPVGIEVEEAMAVPVPGVEVVPGVAGEVVPDTETMSPDDATVLPVGLIVAEVMADGPAALAGLAAGDLILQIDGVPAATPDDLIHALKGHTPGEVTILLVQKGGPVGAVIEEIPVTLGAAPDDTAQAYLGIRFVAPEVNVAPSADYFTAPAVPVIPPMPEMAPGYDYRGLYSGYICGYLSAQPYVYPPAYAVPYTVPVLPFMPAQPPMAAPVAPPAPYYIYSYGVNPEVYPYTEGEKVEKNVILYRAQPGVGGAEVQSFEMKVEPWTMPIPQEGKSVSVWTEKVDDGQAVEVYAYPAMPVPDQKDVMIWRSQDEAGGNYVYAVPSEVQSDDIAVQGAPVKSYTVQVAPEAQSERKIIEVVPFDPAAGSAVPQEAEDVVTPAAVGDWY